MSRSADPRKVGDVLDAIMKMAEENKFNSHHAKATSSSIQLLKSIREMMTSSLCLFSSQVCPQDSTNDVAVSIYSLLCRRPTNSIRANFKKDMADAIKASAELRKASFMNQKIVANLCQ